MLQMVDLGTPVDMLTKGELSEALAEDARLRAVVAGVRQGEVFLNSATAGTGAATFTTTGTPPQSPTAGYVWAIMNIGMELSAASQVRVYKGSPAFSGPGTVAPVGNGRLVTTLASFITPSNQFSKGQLTLKAGDQLTFIDVTGTVNILSIFLAYIEVPAERQGELWL